jgi:hypothetical protein
MANSISGDFRSVFASEETYLDTDPHSRFWLAACPVSVQRDAFGQLTPGMETSIRSRWTGQYLFVLFECPYQTLYLKPDPRHDEKTWGLWNWDVVELFIGDDWDHIERYREFELSPQGEWLDLAIDRNPPDLERNRAWTSGFSTAAWIDASAGAWYGAMRIPFEAITQAPVAEGTKFRVNFYRMEGPPGRRRHVAWRETRSDSFHVPSAFGSLMLTS